MATRVDTAQDREIELISFDEISIKVRASLLEKFTWFAGMINFEPDKNFVKLENVSGENLRKIGEWMEYEGTGKMPALIDPDTHLLRKLTEWEENFTNDITDEELIELMIDADFLSMKNFLEILTTVTSLRIVTYPIEKVRAMFYITDSEYTPQEEQKLESEIQWALRFHE